MLGGEQCWVGASVQNPGRFSIRQAADQFANAHAGAAAGASLTLLPGQATRDAVRDAATRMLAEPSFRSGAQRIQSELRSMPSPDHVASVIERLVSTCARE